MTTLREGTGEYEVELTLAGRPVFVIAKINDVVATARQERGKWRNLKNGSGTYLPNTTIIEWSEAYVTLTKEDVVFWESIVKPEDLDTFRLTGDEQLFDAIQEVAEREAVPS